LRFGFLKKILELPILWIKRQETKAKWGACLVLCKLILRNCYFQAISWHSFFLEWFCAIKHHLWTTLQTKLFLGRHMSTQGFSVHNFFELQKQRKWKITKHVQITACFCKKITSLLPNPHIFLNSCLFWTI
jgi:hypothetical protein